MAARLVGGYLKVFLKDYNREQLDLSLINGEVTLKSIREQQRSCVGRFPSRFLAHTHAISPFRPHRAR
jgi:hypothetical protein